MIATCTWLLVVSEFPHDPNSPRYSYNADEVGVDIAGLSLPVVTARKTVRTPAEQVEHVSLMLCTCADGTLLPPTFIWKEQGKTITPITPCLHEPAFEGFSDSGYMTTELFGSWLLHFCTKVNGMREKSLLLLE